MLALAAGSASLAGAELSPADVNISDIAEAAQRGCGGFEFVVREVHARLATRMRRAALIRGIFLSPSQAAKHANEHAFRYTQNGRLAMQQLPWPPCMTMRRGMLMK